MRIVLLSLSAILMVFSVGCNTTPSSEAKKVDLSQNVNNSLSEMRKEDPAFGTFVDKCYGYVCFPSVGKAGFVVGGAFGRGEVYEQGRLIGYADITQATVGLQAGGQAFTEVICFENKAALDKFIKEDYALAAQASAIALKSGAAANAKYTDGVAIFYYAKGGLMAEASLGGQRFRFTPVR